MYAVYGERTQRSAKIQPPKEKPVVVDMIEVRRLKRLAQAAADCKKRAMEEQLHRERVMQANDAIRRANQALAALRQRDPFYRASANGKQLSSIDVIMSRICRATGVTRADIMSPRRAKRIAFVRQAVFYWTYRRTSMTLPEIGRALGGFDHTTILHALKVYPEKRKQQGRTLRDARTYRGDVTRGRVG